MNSILQLLEGQVGGFVLASFFILSFIAIPVAALTAIVMYFMGSKFTLKRKLYLFGSPIVLFGLGFVTFVTRSLIVMFKTTPQ